jgi:hypothetical protein
MDAYVFQAALYCNDCGEALVRDLRQRGVEDTDDSNDFPQGPYPEGGGEADTPQHCDNGAHCLGAESIGGRRVGAFLENPLTSDGEAYVRESLATAPGSPLARFWAEHYGIEQE